MSVACSLSARTVTVAALLAAAAAQTPTTPELLTEGASAIAPGSDPITGGPGGLWACGANYKVSLHDGLVYYPYVGGALPHQPVRWTTTGVRLGSDLLLAAPSQPLPRYSDFRCDYDFGAVVERYDIRADGVEQSFVIAEPATGAKNGDLVVEGRVTTPLLLPSQGYRHGALQLRLADGRAVVEYGAATAIDAAGRKFEVATSSDGDIVRLRLAAENVAAVKWPLVVDPLVGNVMLEAGAQITDSDVLHETITPIGTQARTWVGYTRLVAANDHDVFVRRFATAFGGAPVDAFRENTLWDAEHVSLTTATASSEVVVVFSTGPNGGGALRVVGIHQHLASDLVLRTSYVAPFTTAADSDWRPVVGGTQAGTEVFIAWQRDNAVPFANTANSAVYGGVYDTVNNAVSVPAFVLRNRPNRDQERPAINRLAATGEWLVAFQEHDGTVANDDWDVVLYEVDNLGVATATGVEVATAGTATLHKLAPQIEGAAGRYCLTYGTQVFQLPSPKPQNTICEALYTQRVDVDHTTGTGTLPWPQITLATAGSAVLVAGGMAFDDISASHWCGTWKDLALGTYTAHKLGYHGIVVESLPISVAGFVPDVGHVAFNRAQRQFHLCYGLNNGTANGNQIAGQVYAYDTVPAPTTYGFGCGAGVVADVTAMADKVQIGAQGLTFALSGAPEDGFGLLLLSLGSANEPLDWLGLNGCTLLVDGNAPNFLGQYVVPIVGGHAAMAFDLPEYLPPLRAFGQWGYPATGANPANLQASNAVDLTIGR